MSNAITRAIKKVRGKNRKVIPHASTKARKMAEYYGKKRQQEMWERDKAIVRDANFVRMKKGLDRYREEQKAEKERQDLIAIKRLENLSKARKALKKIRSQK